MFSSQSTCKRTVVGYLIDCNIERCPQLRGKTRVLDWSNISIPTLHSHAAPPSPFLPPCPQVSLPKSAKSPQLPFKHCLKLPNLPSEHYDPFFLLHKSFLRITPTPSPENTGSKVLRAVKPEPKTLLFHARWKLLIEKEHGPRCSTPGLACPNLHACSHFSI